MGTGGGETDLVGRLDALAVGPFEMTDGIDGPVGFGSGPWFGFPFSFWAKDGGPERVFECERGGRSCGVVWDWELVRGFEAG